MTPIAKAKCVCGHSETSHGYWGGDNLEECGGCECEQFKEAPMEPKMDVEKLNEAVKIIIEVMHGIVETARWKPVKDEWPKVGDRVYAINIESFEPGEFIFDRNDAKFFKNTICWNHFKTAAHRDGAIELIKKYRKDLGYE